MLICINCEIEIEEKHSTCPQCGGPLDEILDDDIDDEFEDDELENAEEGEDEAEAASSVDEGAPVLSEAPPAEELPEAPPVEESPEAPPVEESPEAPPVEELPEAPPAEELPEAPSVEESLEAPSDQALDTPGEDPKPPADPEKKADDRAERRRKLRERTQARKAAGKEAAKDRPSRKKKDRPEKKAPRAKKDDKPKGPRSIWLPQRRAPVILATLMTVFVSLYMISDFVASVLVHQLHAIWIILGPCGLLAALFLWGHGKLGRLGAFILGFCGLAAGVFFMARGNLENYLFIMAMVAFNLMLLVTLMGKGWFLRTAGGFLLSIFVVAGCLCSLALDFLPSVARKRAEKALDVVAEAKGSLDMVRIEAAKEEPKQALAMYADLLQYLDHVPFEKMPEPVQDILYGLMGRERVTKLYLMPVRLQREVMQLSPELVDQLDPEGLSTTFKDQEWVEIDQLGVEEGSVRILKPGRKISENEEDVWESAFFNSETDFEVEYGGLFAKTRIRRTEQTHVPQNEPVRLFFQYFNTERDEVLGDAWKYIVRAKNFMTGGDPSQVGMAVGRMFTEREVKGRIFLTNFGHMTLDNFLYFDIQNVWIHLDQALADLEEGMRRDDAAKKEKGAAAAREIIAFYDKELFNTLGWMVKRLDVEDDPGGFARNLLGSDEFPFIYMNYVRLNWALYKAGDKKEEALFEEARQCMVQVREIVTTNEPAKFRQVADRMYSRHLNQENRLWEARWRKAIQIDAMIQDEQERLEIASGNAPQQEKLMEQDWEILAGAGDEGIYRLRFKDYSVLSLEVNFIIELRDKNRLLDGERKSVFRNFQLRRDRMPMEVGIIDTGGAEGAKLAFTIKEIVGTDAEGNPVKNQSFTLKEGLTWTGGAGEIVNPEPTFEQPADFEKVTTLKIVIEITRAQ